MKKSNVIEVPQKKFDKGLKFLDVFHDGCARISAEAELLMSYAHHFRFVGNEYIADILDEIAVSLINTQKTMSDAYGESISEEVHNSQVGLTQVFAVAFNQVMKDTL